LIGKTEASGPGRVDGWLTRLAGYKRRYLAVDGGGGGRLLAGLSTMSGGLRRVFSPRHAELLLIFEPVSHKLAPSIVELYQAMPQPRRALGVGEPGPDRFPHADLVRLEDLLPGLERISDSPGGPRQIEQRMRTLPLRPDQVSSKPEFVETTIPVPGKQEREIATEPVVLSLGPIQSLTAGPLRLLLTCDGEQVVSAQTEAGYAARNVAYAMTQACGPEVARLASLLDPLAPIAGRIAYVQALEQLQRQEPDLVFRQQREAALALERAQNHVRWLIGFAELLADDRLTVAARQLDAPLVDASTAFWEPSPTEWIVPQGSPVLVRSGRHKDSLARLATEICALRSRLERNRVLALRTAGIGVLSVHLLRAAGVSGPTLYASERGRGDVLGRLLTRLDEAAADLRQVAASASTFRSVEGREAVWSAPSGKAEVTVAGPRGQIGLSLASHGEGPGQVTWRRPSTALLSLIPELLAGQKLADAEVIVASLDLAMAEADG